MEFDSLKELFIVYEIHYYICTCNFVSESKVNKKAKKSKGTNSKVTLSTFYLKSTTIPKCLF